MRRLLIALALPALLGAAPPPPHRIVSLNLCADQLLLAVADRSQVAALTSLSRDPAMSAVAGEARSFPVTGGSAEAVMALRPDLVIAGPGTWDAAADALGHDGPRTLTLPPAESYAAIVAQVAQIAAAVGHPERGRVLIARMNAALAQVPRAVGRGRVAAFYQRRGYLTGTGTLVDELMRRVGLLNLAARLGRPPLSQLSLEQLVAAQPDLLITETGTDRVTDQGSELLHHPVLAHIPRIELPEAWTVCGGPAYVRAAQSLAGQLDALDRHQKRALTPP